MRKNSAKWRIEDGMRAEGGRRYESSPIRIICFLRSLIFDSRRYGMAFRKSDISTIKFTLQSTIT